MASYLEINYILVSFTDWQDSFDTVKQCSFTYFISIFKKPFFFLSQKRVLCYHWACLRIFPFIIKDIFLALMFLFFLILFQALEDDPQELENCSQAEPQVEPDDHSSDYDGRLSDDFSDTGSCHDNEVTKIVLHLSFNCWLENLFGATVCVCSDQAKVSLEEVCMHAWAVVCVYGTRKIFLFGKNKSSGGCRGLKAFSSQTSKLHHILE